MITYSIIIPVYNRPDEIDELLKSLCEQTFKQFEVIIVEDGSSKKCDLVVDKFKDTLDIHYFYKENSGQGFSRNFGYQKASGSYFIVFDSDCLIPARYLEIVDAYLTKNYLDVFGGPDRAHSNFTIVQKAISYSMTSVFTTGGIRGNKKHIGKFHPRSFNMGLSREVFEKTGGYIITRMGEDIELSIRAMVNGFKVGLIEDAFVYHKRRTSIIQFWKQLFFFGRARINVRRFYPEELKLVHLFPAFFVIYLLFWALSYFYFSEIFQAGAVFLIIYYLLILVDCTIKYKNLWVGVVSIITSFIQITAYGTGAFKELFFSSSGQEVRRP